MRIHSPGNRSLLSQQKTGNVSSCLLSIWGTVVTSTAAVSGKLCPYSQRLGVYFYLKKFHIQFWEQTKKVHKMQTTALHIEYGVKKYREN